MNNRDRHQTILRLLGENSNLRVADLSQSLGVSEATIRRDLERLHEMGRIQRFHGGATLSSTAVELPVLQRISERMDVKQRIGRAAAALIHDGNSVFIGSGTTALEVARALTGRRDLTVITNAHTVVDVLAREEGISVICTGGVLRHSELSYVGYITEGVLRDLRPQKVFMGIRALSLADGLTSDYLPEVTTDRVIIRSAPEVILLVDASKIGKVATAFVAPLSAIHRLVTDDCAPQDFIEAVQAQGIEVIVA